MTQAFGHFGIPVTSNADFAPTLEGLSAFIHNYLRSSKASQPEERPRRLLDRLVDWTRF